MKHSNNSATCRKLHSLHSTKPTILQRQNRNETQ